MRPNTDKIPVPERQVELLELIGSTLDGKYKLDRLLGAGGMGGVYAATPLAGGAQVAIKVLSVADPASRERIAGRFAREARAVTALSCPHIVSVLDAGSALVASPLGGEPANRPYLVMELLEGEDLGQRLRREGRMPLRDALHMAAQVLVALGVAHERGIIHRDLKPDNLFLMNKDGDATYTKLLDFGMSKLTPREGATIALALTKKGMAVGTPFYMAPEQARALPDVDGRADLWSIGAIIFECLTGRPPFVGPSQEQTLIAICTTEAPDVRAMQPDVPSKVAKLIAKSLSRDRKNRFLSAWQMLEAIAEVAPAEGRLVPAKSFTAIDVPVPAAPAMLAPQAAAASARVPSAPDRSGPISPMSSGRIATIVAAPLPAIVGADGSGPHSASRSGPHGAAHSGPYGAARSGPYGAVRPPQVIAKRRSNHLPLVIVGICALVLGVGVAIYALAMMRR